MVRDHVAGISCPSDLTNDDDDDSDDTKYAHILRIIVTRS